MDWETIRRETGLIEHVCEHGIGHPNMASTYRMAWMYADSPESWQIHGCDSCCYRQDFPGSLINTLIFSYKMYEEKELIGYLCGIWVDDEWVSLLHDVVYEDGSLARLHDCVYLYGEDFLFDLRDEAEFMYWGIAALLGPGTLGD